MLVAVSVGEWCRRSIMIFVMPGAHEMAQFVGKRVIARGTVIEYDRESGRCSGHDGIGEAAEIGFIDDHRRKVGAGRGSSILHGRVRDEISQDRVERLAGLGVSDLERIDQVELDVDSAVYV